MSNFAAFPDAILDQDSPASGARPTPTGLSLAEIMRERNDYIFERYLNEASPTSNLPITTDDVLPEGLAVFPGSGVNVINDGILITTFERAIDVPFRVTLFIDGVGSDLVRDVSIIDNYSIASHGIPIVAYSIPAFEVSAAPDASVHLRSNFFVEQNELSLRLVLDLGPIAPPDIIFAIDGVASLWKPTA